LRLDLRQLAAADFAKVEARPREAVKKISRYTGHQADHAPALP
jgi:hypothetical protein